MGLVFESSCVEINPKPHRVRSIAKLASYVLRLLRKAPPPCRCPNAPRASSPNPMNGVRGIFMLELVQQRIMAARQEPHTLRRSVVYQASE